MSRGLKRTACGVALAVFASMGVHASSHKEAPGITKTPKVDGTDLYMFRSYEPGRTDYVTILANYIPLQNPSDLPNLEPLDPEALYEIHVDNNGDALADMTFRFRFRNTLKNLTVPVGDQDIPIPLINRGRVGPGKGDTAELNLIETYTLELVRPFRRNGRSGMITSTDTGGRRFLKPVDRIGDKSIRDDTNTIGSLPPNDVYNTYADDHMYSVKVPGCEREGRVFVGQRREGFVINVTELLDLINTNPIGPRDGEANGLAGKNVTTLALEVPMECLTRTGQPIIGAWTTASLSNRPDGSLFTGGNGPTQDRNGDRADRGDRDADRDDDRTPSYHQVSRLGNPLVNEVVIGYKDKDSFNASEPSGDGAFLKYVTHPSMPAIIESLFGFAGVTAPAVPRADLVSVFLTGVAGLNQPEGVVPGEMMRLNTSIAPKPPEAQDSLGVLGGDTAGFPNGRRPGDDVVDIELRVLMGALLPATQAPSGQLAYTDGALTNATIAYTPAGAISADPQFALFRNAFPYLQVPLSASPAPPHMLSTLTP